MPAAPDRRRVLRLVAAGGAMVVLAAHTPYRQWEVYRQKHLLIGTHREDPRNYPLGKELAAAMADALPESSARVTRGPDAHRLAALLTTGQLPVVLLATSEVEALADGRAPFGDFAGAEIRTLASTDSHHLIVLDGFPDHHAWRVTDALPPSLAPRPAPGVPLHDGVLARLAGRPMPAAPPPVEADHQH